jgi:hypothetical protein
MTTGVAMDARSYLGMLLGVASCISNLLARQQDLREKIFSRGLVVEAYLGASALAVIFSFALLCFPPGPFRIAPAFSLDASAKILSRDENVRLKNGRTEIRQPACA